uniref:Uncharacterized protein n=1 Tax=Cacopsylla melanoneura TaxID=428564 RepID=A0A8D8XLE8_9HEMI
MILLNEELSERGVDDEVDGNEESTLPLGKGESVLVFLASAFSLLSRSVVEGALVLEEGGGLSSSSLSESLAESWPPGGNADDSSSLEEEEDSTGLIRHLLTSFL